jgi:hypothetical protein
VALAPGLWTANVVSTCNKAKGSAWVLSLNSNLAAASLSPFTASPSASLQPDGVVSLLGTLTVRTSLAPVCGVTVSGSTIVPFNVPSVKLASAC